MLVKSAYPDCCVPEENFADYILKTIANYPGEKTAIVSAFSEKSYTYNDIIRYVKRGASFFNRLGLRKGDVVALCSPNTPEFMLIFLATAACGGIITTCNPLYTTYEIMQQLKDSKPIFVFAVPENVQKVKEVADSLCCTKEVFVIGDHGGFRSFESIINAENGMFYPDSVSIDIYKDILVLPYSSGTTGFPKGVILSHYNFVSSIIISRINWKGFPHDVEYLILPMFHIYGMLRLFSRIDQGGTLIVDERFTLERLGEAIQQYKVTSCPLVPPILLLLAKSQLETTYNLSSLKNITVGAAPISPELAELVSKKFHCFVDQAWGLTETTGVSVIQNQMAWNISSKSSGLVCPLNTMKVCDINTGRELGVNEVGELLVKGPEVMLGYYNQPEATAATLDQDGFLHTGDIGYFDEFNQFYVKDRLKELIKYKGFQVAPAEIEHVLLAHHQIADAAVIGIPDLSAGEVPKAFVVKRTNTLTGDQVRSYVEEQLSSYKHLRGGVEFVKSIPKSASGKILRRLIREKEKKKRQAAL